MAAVCECIYACTCVHECVGSSAQACMYACILVSVCARVHTCSRAWMHARVCAHAHACSVSIHQSSVSIPVPASQPFHQSVYCSMSSSASLLISLSMCKPVGLFGCLSVCACVRKARPGSHVVIGERGGRRGHTVRTGTMVIGREERRQACRWGSRFRPCPYRDAPPGETFGVPRSGPSAVLPAPHPARSRPAWPRCSFRYRAATGLRCMTLRCKARSPSPARSRTACRPRMASRPPGRSSPRMASGASWPPPPHPPRG